MLVCVHACVCRFICTCACVYVEARCWCQVSSSLILHIVFRDRVFLFTKSLWMWLDLLASKPQDLPLPQCWDYRTCIIRLLLWMLGIQERSSGFHGKCLSNSATSPAQVLSEMPHAALRCFFPTLVVLVNPTLVSLKICSLYPFMLWY